MTINQKQTSHGNICVNQGLSFQQQTPTRQGIFMQSRRLSRAAVCALMMLSVSMAFAQVPPPMPPEEGPPGEEPQMAAPENTTENTSANSASVQSSSTKTAVVVKTNADASPVTTATTGPATQSVSTATAPAGPVATDVYLRAESESPNNSRVAFNFKDATVDTILDYLSDSLGFIVIKDSRNTTRVTVTSRQPVNAGEAVDLLNSVLEPVNYTVLQRGRVLRVLPRDKAKKANIPVKFGADPAKIKNSDEIITQVIPVSNVDAVKLRSDLSSFLSSDADITSNAGSNTIIITDTSARIRRVVEVISALDQHRTAVNDIRTFQLKYANATSTAKLINDIFKQDTTSTSGNNQNPFQNLMRQRFGGGPGGMGQQGNDTNTNSGNGNAVAGKINAAADDRTNMIVVTGPTESLKLVERVISEIDSNPAADQVFFIYRVKNGTAANMEYTLNTLFGNPTSAPTSSNSRSSSSSSSSSSGSRSSSSSGSSFSSTGSSSNRQVTSNSRSSSSSGRTGTSGSSLSSSSATAASLLTGQVYVVSDSDTNSLLIATSQRYLSQAKQILTELDRSVKQVLIKVLVAEVQHTDSTDLGVNYGELTVTENLGYVAPGGAAAGNVLNGNATPRSFFGTVSSSMTATMRALASKGKIDVLSRPYVLTSDNQPATMRVGQDVPYTTSTQITDSGQVINSNSYRSLGITLDVTPHVNPDGLVVLDVIQEVSQMNENSSVTLSGNTTSPIFDIRRADSRVAIRNGQTIVIGGLMQDKKTGQVDKVPLLGDIPLLGGLFKRDTTSKVKTELLVFLTPHVVDEPDKLKNVTQDEISGVEIVPNAVGEGIFQKHIKGMMRGATTQPTELKFPDVPKQKE